VTKKGDPIVAETKRLSVNLSEKAYKDLEAMANEAGISMTEVVRKAIGMEKFLTEAQNKNQKILLEDTNGTIQRIVVR
jgi:metal-responsive CopG/Arc/MetJ family transcriptional regulator